MRVSCPEWRGSAESVAGIYGVWRRGGVGELRGGGRQTAGEAERSNGLHERLGMVLGMQRKGCGDSGY
ncbi:hypothetical protein E2C01_092069 [Portunus trituberculatus]|uniref:Uncharacterized protein n=1 Tax=Portunus trituberculatus TaxID=210409 RepID=A0A5B7JFK5_PORTR|nr:hypothetical protein [Portunus trituberculatus]